MTRPNSVFLSGLLVVSILTSPLAGGEESSPEEPAKYTLRYKFKAGETLRWQTVHRALVKATVSGVTDTSEMVSKSIKVWRVTQVKDDGTVVFENMVESVDMRQKRTGREEIRYNSLTDKEPPPEYKMIPETVGVRLSTITLSANGKVLGRKKEKKENAPAAAQNTQGELTIPFPEEPIAVGRSWSFPHEITLPLNNRTFKKVKAEQKFKLEQVKTGIAKISVATVILTPIHNPVIEGQLLQHASTGTVRFDIEAGRVIGQQMDVDKRVVGFVGSQDPTSVIHYLTRFTEEFLTSKPAVAKTKTDDPKPKTASADKKADDPDSKSASTASTKKETDDAKPKTASAGKKTDEPVSKTATTDKKTDDSGSKVAKSEGKVESGAKHDVAAKPDGSGVKK